MEDRNFEGGCISYHLRTRCQQRGVRKADFETQLDWADCFVSVGGRRTAITLTRRGATGLRGEGLAAGIIERMGRRAVIMGENGDAITVVVPHRRRGRHYRRGVRRRRGGRR